MANNKVQLADGTVLIDITDTTAVASDVAAGKYFYNAAGVKTLGTNSGGGGIWTKLIDWTAEEDVASVTFTKGDYDEVLADCTEMWLLMLVCPQTATEYTSGIKVGFSGTNVWTTGNIWVGSGIKSSVTGSYMYMLHLVKTPMGILCDARNESYNNGSQINIGTFVSRSTAPYATYYSGLTNSSKNVGANLDNLISDQSFTKILVGGYQTVIGTGSQIRVWGGR